MNEEDQFMFYLTVHCLLPQSRVAVRHLSDIIEVDNIKTHVRGFRVLVEQAKTRWAVYAVLMTEPCQD